MMKKMELTKTAHFFISFIICVFTCQGQTLINDTNRDYYSDSIPLDKLNSKYSAVIRVLDSIYFEDQKYRVIEDSIQHKLDPKSQEYLKLLEVMNKSDARNVKIVTNLLDTYGWLGPKDIGATANKTIFLVIQHSSLETQEKYLQMMKDAVLEGNANSSELAMLIDRIEVSNNRPQIYGSQLQMVNGEPTFYPIINPESLNYRREKVGLPDFEEYKKIFTSSPEIKAIDKLSTFEIFQIIAVICFLSLGIVILLSKMLSSTSLIRFDWLWFTLICLFFFIMNWFSKRESLFSGTSEFIWLLDNLFNFSLSISTILIVYYNIFRLLSKWKLILKVVAIFIGVLLTNFIINMFHQQLIPFNRNNFLPFWYQFIAYTILFLIPWAIIQSVQYFKKND